MNRLILCLTIFILSLTGCDKCQKTGKENKNDVIVDFVVPETVPLGSDVILTVNLFNKSQENRTAEVVISGEMINYRGDPLGEANRISKVINIGPGKSNSVELVISQSQYSYALCETRIIESTASLGIYETGQEYFNRFKRTFLTNKNIEIALLPAAKFKPGETVRCEARWANPLSITLHNVFVRFNWGEHFNVNGKSGIDINVPDVLPGGQVYASQNITGVSPGSDSIIVELFSNELNGFASVQGEAEIIVVPKADNK